MKKWALIVALLIIPLVAAGEVCVVVDYGDGEPDSKCLNIEDGKSGYDLLESTGFEILWTPESEYGHMVCRINDVGLQE